MADDGNISDSDINITDSDDEQGGENESPSGGAQPSGAGLKGNRKKKRNRSGEGEKEVRMQKRKERHNEVERKRRTLMNDKLDELRSLLPGCSGDTSKADCLVSAVSYINWLHHQSAALYGELVKRGIEYHPESTVNAADTGSYQMSLPPLKPLEDDPDLKDEGDYSESFDSDK